MTHDPTLILAQMYVESRISNIGKVRLFHPSKKDVEKKTREALQEIEEKTGFKMQGI